MGFGGISIWQLLIILAIVVLIFGTKKLKNMGSDVGGAVKNFKSAMNDDDKHKDKDDDAQQRLSTEEQGRDATSEKDSDKHHS